jgi:hypothetical protein
MIGGESVYDVFILFGIGHIKENRNLEREGKKSERERPFTSEI